MEIYFSIGSSKKEQYLNYQIEFALRAKALGHAARIAIVEYLSQYTFATNEELRKLVQLHSTTVFQHLSVLVKAGIVNEGFVDNRHFYFLNQTAKTQFAEVIRVFDSSRGFQK